MIRIEQLKDILDEWCRGRPDGSEISRAAIIRRSPDSCLHPRCVHAPSVYVLCVDGSSYKDHDLYEPFDFISDEEVEKAFHILAPLVAAFGKKIPNATKIRSALCWLNREHTIWPVHTKKRIIRAASLIK